MTLVFKGTAGCQTNGNLIADLRIKSFFKWVRRLYIAIFFAIGSPLSAGGAGTPFFDLGTFFEDVVASSIMSDETSGMWPQKTSDDAQLRSRNSPENDARVVRLYKSGLRPLEAQCDGFQIVPNDNSWRQHIQQGKNSSRALQGRWRGVSSYLDYTVSSGLRSVYFAAAVRDPGIPHDRFSEDGAGGLKFQYFEIASANDNANFGRFLQEIKPLSMSMNRREQCNGFSIYIWSLE